jgi:hypothetical protein
MADRFFGRKNQSENYMFLASSRYEREIKKFKAPGVAGVHFQVTLPFLTLAPIPTLPSSAHSRTARMEGLALNPSRKGDKT